MPLLRVHNLFGERRLAHGRVPVVNLGANGFSKQLGMCTTSWRRCVRIVVHQYIFRSPLPPAAHAQIQKVPQWSEAVAWLDENCGMCSNEQKEYITSWAERVVMEAGEGVGQESQPFQRLLHAIPGAGTSFYTRKIVAFFEEVMKWTRGVHFIYAFCK